MKKVVVLFIALFMGIQVFANFFKDFNAGVNYAKMGNYSQAEKSFLKALGERPDSTDAMWGLVNIYVKTKQIGKTLIWVNKIIGVNAKDKKAYLLAAQVLLDNSREQEAKSYLDSLFKIDPNNVDGKLLLGRYYAAQGNYDKAFSVLKEVANKSPKKAYIAYKTMGDLAFINMKDYKKAANYYLKTLAMKGANKDYLNKKIAYCYFLQKDWNNGLKYISQINKLETADYKWIAIAYEKLKKYNQAIKYYEKVYSKNKKASDIAIKLSDLYKKIGNSAKSKYYMKLAESSASIDYKTAYKLGYQLLKQRKYQAAIKQFERSIAGKGDFYGSWYALGMAQYLSGQKDKALNSFLKAERLNPNYVYTLRYLATIYDNNKNYDKGLVYWKKVATLQPNDPNVWYFIGLDAGYVGDNQTAAAAFEKVVKMQPKNKDGWYNLSIAYQKLNKPSLAADALQKYHELGGK